MNAVNKSLEIVVTMKFPDFFNNFKRSVEKVLEKVKGKYDTIQLGFRYSFDLPWQRIGNPKEIVSVNIFFFL